MTRIRRNIDRFDRITTEKVDDVEALRQAQEVAIVFEVTGASAAFEIGAVRRAGDGGKVDRITPYQAIALGIGCVQRKIRGHARNSPHDLVAVQVDLLFVPVDARAILLVQRKRFPTQNLQAHLFENAHRGIMY